MRAQKNGSFNASRLQLQKRTLSYIPEAAGRNQTDCNNKITGYGKNSSYPENEQ